MYRLASIFVLSAFLLVQWAHSPLSASDTTKPQGLEPPEVPGALQPIVRVPAEFPSNAPDTLRRGWVVIEFTLTEKGGVRDARAVRSSDPVFEEAALSTVRRWKFRPILKNGVPEVSEGAKVVVKFERKPKDPIPQWKPVGLSSGLTVHVLPLRIIIDKERFPIDRDDPSKGFGLMITIEFFCQVRQDPEHSDVAEAADIARELVDVFVDGEVKSVERKGFGPVSVGTVAFVTEPVDPIRPGFELPADVLRFRFNRVDGTGWRVEE